MVDGTQMFRDSLRECPNQVRQELMKSQNRRYWNFLIVLKNNKNIMSFIEWVFLKKIELDTFIKVFSDILKPQKVDFISKNDFYDLLYKESSSLSCDNTHLIIFGVDVFQNNNQTHINLNTMIDYEDSQIFMYAIELARHINSDIVMGDYIYDGHSLLIKSTGEVFCVIEDESIEQDIIMFYPDSIHKADLNKYLPPDGRSVPKK
ncbi:hypothetical protein Fleli_2684 [Bernardetia litoralis DSM 6794]|uniref:Uncharacterized protein n=1 Tax=Bernardetia litoralis (strain ATCC 23117 / DSM 6794 / NBRC 15988 / NCIMB 1366 / Fx l1 / Sio-4) TaxID=880071 RepID=I4AM56_BERLS|nr:hypothetical protein [Bernardetia litoralis]AFM05041.1 hypothetical protein Fleli_2684 [Bernardetia litoralis DSM 6794]